MKIQRTLLASAILLAFPPALFAQSIQSSGDGGAQQVQQVRITANPLHNGGETNYISATLRIYLDIYNVFTSMLQLLGIGFGQRD